MSRVIFDDGKDMPPVLPALSSLHWQGLEHKEGDRMIHTIPDLQELLVHDLSDTTTNNNDNTGQVLAFWSCLVGYAESLSTHKQQRYQIFPLPWDALHRLVDVEFATRIQSITLSSTVHRDAVKSIANTIWAQTLAKPNTRDEVHANSVYVWLRGRIDRKSLDCFGAAVTTIAGCHVRGLTSSQLCLSEDHAYERHVIDDKIGTCEVAVPGNTKEAQAKRGRDIAETFAKNAKVTPETSWLYMASNPVICDSLPMMLVAVMANINCTIDKPKGQKVCLASGQLYDFKRELLWTLYDHGHMAKFPFGLLELGDCEEHRGSSRSEEWVTVDSIPEPILQNEKLYWDAIHINKSLYNEAQSDLTIPATFDPFLASRWLLHQDAGHYHKDAGNEGLNGENEYRLAHAVKHYADAARVASNYRYEGIDCLQLNKHMTSAATLIAEDILTPKYKFTTAETKTTKPLPRQWTDIENEICTGTWVLGFFDSLLYWEETSSDGKRFVEVLSPIHQYGMGKLLQLFSHETRLTIIRTISNSSNEITDRHKVLPPSFCNVRSKRLGSGSLLLQALAKPEVSIREMELAIPFADDSDGDRRSKRARR